jgi:hypothetical protein
MTTHFVDLALGQPGTASRRADRPCCGLTWLRWIRPVLGAYHSNIGGGEVITDAQYGVPGSLGERVCEAITEIQPGGMTPFAISPPAAHRPGGQVCINRHDVDLRVTEEPVPGCLACSSRAQLSSGPWPRGRWWPAGIRIAVASRTRALPARPARVYGDRNP